MSELLRLAVEIGLILTSIVATWWLTNRQAARHRDRQTRSFEDRTERQRVAFIERSAADRRVNESARQEAVARAEALEAQLRAQEEATAASEQRAVTALAELEARARAERTQLEAKLARVDAERLAAEHRVTELQSTSTQRVADATNVAQRRFAELEEQRRRAVVEAVAREQELGREASRWQQRARSLQTVCHLEAVTSLTTYVDRPAPVELEAIARRVRGLAFIDSVTIADAAGLPLDRGTNRDGDDLAGLTPTVGRASRELEPVLGTTRGVTIYTADSRVVELRALPAWTSRAWLVAQSSAQRPPPAALDGGVALALAMRGVELPSEPEVRLAGRGRLGPGGARSDALADELERATRGLGVRTVALVVGDGVLSGVETEGLGAEGLEAASRALHLVQAAALGILRASSIARVEIDLASSVRLSLSSLGSRSRLGLVMVTVGRPLDPLEVERIEGRLRRFLDASGPALVGGQAHA